MNQVVVDSIFTIAALLFLAFLFYLVFLIFCSLKKYLKTKDVRKNSGAIKKSLGKILKEHRIQCKMTQEFVAESLGVSRQTVSKWENGVSDPSTSNLFVLAKLYGKTAQELLQEINQ